MRIRDMPMRWLLVLGVLGGCGPTGRDRGAARPGLSGRPSPAARPATRLPPSLHAVASRATLHLGIGRTGAWLAEATGVAPAPGGAHGQPTSLGEDGGADNLLHVDLDRHLRALPSGAVAPAVLVLADAGLPAQRLVDAVRGLVAYRRPLAIRLAVLGPTGRTGAHVMALEPPAFGEPRLWLGRGGFRLDAAGALQPLGQLPALLAELPAATRGRNLAIDDVGSISLAELVQVLDVVADAGIPGVGLGHMADVDLGTGTSAPSTYREPAVDLEPAMVTGRLDRDVVRRALRRHLAHIRYCYEKRLLAAPTLAGTLLLRFDVDAAGAASAASATGLDDEVASCVVAVIQRPDFVVGAGPGGAEIALRFRQR